MTNNEIAEIQEAKKNNELSELQISMSHAITRAAHGLTLVEKRIIGLFIAKFDTRKHKRLFDRVISLEDAKLRITAQEYAETFGVDPKNAYNDLLSASERLFERYWRVVQGKMEIKARWIGSVTYHHGEGWMEATFDAKTIPHLVFGLSDQYTKYKLKAAAALTGTYPWRLWELMAQFGNTKKPADEERMVRISLEDFRHSLEIPISYKYKDIRVRVIEPSIEQIKHKNQLDITWRAIKKGRSVYSLEFTFKPSKQLSLFGAGEL